MTTPVTARARAPEPRACVACEGALPSEYPSDVRICRTCDLKRHTNLCDSEGLAIVYRDPVTGETSDLTPELVIAGSGWTFAKTMPKIPHSYTVRDLMDPAARRSTCLSHDTFEWFVHHIRENGEIQPWGRYRNTYLEVGDWKYWSMGAPPEITTIINRTRLDQTGR